MRTNQLERGDEWVTRFPRRECLVKSFSVSDMERRHQMLPGTAHKQLTIRTCLATCQVAFTATKRGKENMFAVLHASAVVVYLI